MKAYSILRYPAHPLRFLAPYDILIIAYVAGSFLLSWWFDFHNELRVFFDVTHDGTILSFAVLALLIVFFVSGVRFRLASGPGKLAEQWWPAMRARYLRVRTFVDLARVMIGLKLTLAAYCNIKQAIPYIHPRLFDAELLALDAMLHGGWNPNLVSLAVVGTGWGTRALDIAYILWYPIKLAVIAVFAISSNTLLRTRFFLAYFSMWMVGGLLAVLIPSLGPIYTHPEWFAENEMPWARLIQGMLWSGYQQLMQTPQLFHARVYEGIAAFPSLHVGLVALFALFLRHLHSTAGRFMWCYVLIMQVGSVHLGWHYALDGYVGVLLAYLLYRVAGCYGDSRDDRPLDISRNGER